MAQTILASRKFRKKAAAHIVDGSEVQVLECGDGLRLQGSLTRHCDPRGLFIFLHGWEGSEHSAYVLSSSRFVYDQGYSVFRLNFRDHGDTHHLNKDIFHAQRFAEVFQAVKQIAGQAGAIPVYLVGFSLGGNFGLRIARELAKQPIKNLVHIFAISPVIDPLGSAPIIDESFMIRKYFLDKWTASLRKKQMAFPRDYDFSDLLGEKSVMVLTERFLQLYSDFDSVESYFNGYKIGADDLAAIDQRVSIIMSEDDPVLNAKDVLELNLSSCVDLIMLKYGGHNGFFQSLHGPTWYDDYIAGICSEY
ncbi:MAG: alpha/beta fold hydrolase [Hellea sp.]|nr:alpha/beta fold hydrolase [Hellea sp.]